MRLKNLTIRRTESYETPACSLVASAEFEGLGGAMKIDLAPGFIVQVLKLIEQDAVDRAKRISASVETAMIDAKDESLLIEADAPLTISASADIPF